MGGKRRNMMTWEFQPESDGVDSSPFEGSMKATGNFEWSFNSGWLDIATKITNFINVKTTRTVKLLHAMQRRKGSFTQRLSRIINGQPER
ncbi:hypothetical protein H5410_002148 [Solanum commersonii]|uniref:Uncharacterized protein n=1 Tax=Solanum commersonii TaxID=4109 RepID=A0A9J6B227_SOLCO|nr:hypothetical protein H5410_002148 [Solanum commersonii]